MGVGDGGRRAFRPAKTLLGSVVTHADAAVMVYDAQGGEVASRTRPIDERRNRRRTGYGRGWCRSWGGGRGRRHGVGENLEDVSPITTGPNVIAAHRTGQRNATQFKAVEPGRILVHGEWAAIEADRHTIHQRPERRIRVVERSHVDIADAALSSAAAAQRFRRDANENRARLRCERKLRDQIECDRVRRRQRTRN